MARFLKDIKTTGAISSCSSEVAKALAERAFHSNPQTVVELGSGTGAITRKLVEGMPEEALLLALELNQNFAELTQECCPKAHVYHDSAENVKQCLGKHGKETCDCVVSTLPWTIFTRDMQKKILAAVLDVLPPGGEFLTVTYTFATLLPKGKHFKKLLTTNFSKIKRSKVIWRNLPPVYIYHCHK